MKPWDRLSGIMDQIGSAIDDVWREASKEKDGWEPVKRIPVDMKVKKAWFDKEGLHVVHSIGVLGLTTRHIVFKDCRVENIRW